MWFNNNIKLSIFRLKLEEENEFLGEPQFDHSYEFADNFDYSSDEEIEVNEEEAQPLNKTELNLVFVANLKVSIIINITHFMIEIF